MSIHTMDGYDFERLITQLLKNMGFSVEMTTLSGDGGVDIIAYSNSFIFKGKYLIQCKRWNSTVGEPTVRDLYGVVLSENANKGIIITNSTFSKKAIEFADGKNIELIDGTTIVKLLKEYNMDATNEIAQNNKKSFYEMDNFDGERYFYLKTRIEGNRNEKQNYDSLRVLLHSYIARNEIEVNKNGLIDEYIHLNNDYIQRFCKKSKISLVEKDIVTYINGILYLLKGEVFRAIEIFKEDLKLFETKKLNILLFDYSLNNYSFGSESGKTAGEFVERIRDEYGSTYHIRRNINKSPELMIINIYLILFKLKYREGLNSIISRVNSIHETAINGNYTEAGKYRFNLLFKDIKVTMEEINQGTYNKLYFPINLDYKIEKNYDKQYFYEFTFDEKTYISVDQLFDQYWESRTLEQEIKLLNILYR